MSESAVTDAKRKVLDLLKRMGPTTAAKLAAGLGLTDVAIRQHLQSLESSGLVRSEKQPAEGRGRPSLLWSLTERAAEWFPDRHEELAIGLIGAMRRLLGEGALARVIQDRAEQQVARYRSLMPGERASLKRRLEALARERTAEGYMAEVVTDRPGSYLLIEHHCPICEAATCCTGLCGAELEVFRQVLGGDVTVERTAHVLSGDERCAYRVQGASGQSY